MASAWRAEPDAAEGNTSSAWLHADLRQEPLPHTMEDVMRFGRFKFGSVQIDGVTYEYDVVIDGGSIRKRKKKPSKPFRNAYGHTYCYDQTYTNPKDRSHAKSAADARTAPMTLKAHGMVDR